MDNEMSEDTEFLLPYFEDLGGCKESQTLYPKKKSILHNMFGNTANSKEKYKESDEFYEDIYEYFYSGGLNNIVISNICEIFLIIIGLAFMTFIFVFLDWSLLLECGKEEHHCGSISNFFIVSFPNIISGTILFCGAIFLMHRIFEFYFSLKRLNFINNYFTCKLQITQRELQTIPWCDILKKIEKINKLSSYDITNRILRRENYYIALIQNNILNISNRSYTKQLEQNLRFVILNDMENLSIDRMRRNFYLLGFLNLIFSPIVLFYLLFYFFISNVEEIYSKNDIGSRRFTLLFKWKIRRYNEMRHFFEQRINRSIPSANKYMRQFPSPITEIFGKSLALICGIFFSFSLLLSILDENILLYIKIFDRSLLFYTGIIGAISTVARSFVKKPENCVYNPTKAMNRFYKHTKYIPIKWKNKFHTYDVRDDFLNFFPYKLLILFNDLLGVLTTPFTLIFGLSRNCEEIFDFIKMNTIYIKKVGSICSCSYHDNSSKLKDSSMIIFDENHRTSTNNFDDSDNSDISQ